MRVEQRTQVDARRAAGSSYGMRPCAPVCEEHALHIQGSSAAEIAQDRHAPRTRVQATKEARHRLGAGVGQYHAHVGVGEDRADFVVAGYEFALESIEVGSWCDCSFLPFSPVCEVATVTCDSQPGG